MKITLSHTALALALAGAASVAGRNGAAATQSIAGSLRVVTNCSDSGPGSLRDAVASAVNGDVVDLSDLTCSTITLSTGAIEIAVDDLTLRGPGASALLIDGNQADRVLHQTTSGVLTVQDLTIGFGNVSITQFEQSILGGCIYSGGDVVLDHSIVTACTVYGPNSNVTGGGAVFSAGNLTLESTTLSDSVAQGINATGGGALAYGDIIARYSSITGNANVSPNPYTRGGGLISFSSMSIAGSTIAGNVAGCGGGLALSYEATIVNSTISGNVAQTYGGGIDDLANTAKISNSTIAFNRAEYGGGLIVGRPPFGPPPFDVDLESSIVSNNVATLASDSADLVLGSAGATIVGANNLIVAAPVVPADTIRLDPMLLPLEDNGGPTLTHSLLLSSPAIDRGNNNDSARYDQRGPEFLRVYGEGADIGAFELQSVTVDLIFRDGFEAGLRGNAI